MTPDKSDTPRTDALLLRINEGRVYKDDGPEADLTRQLERENTRLTAELAEAKKDAERYRWLRAQASCLRGYYEFPSINPFVKHEPNTHEARFDAAIDRASTGDK